MAEKKDEDIVEERFYTIPLKKAWLSSRFERTAKAVRVLKSFLRRHLKTEDFKVSNELNELLWSRGIKNPPRKVRVKVVKDKEGVFTVYPLEEKV
jgi:large subunit ribosomal protein L31e